ncbi:MULTISPECIES: hypothetical protein [unclassified Cupriavidus]|uniref:hypothetical protein n=1 Tax=Cupriavidus sp. H19C3 TaxID=3241603 RepID=UPI003BF83586
MLFACAALIAACGGGQSDAPGRPTAASTAAGSAGASNPPGGTAPDGTLQLPLEVLGDGRPSAPVIAQAELTVDPERLGTASQLWFVCHRCGFFGAPEFEATTEPVTRVKASVRVLGGADTETAATVPWVDVTDANMKLADLERLQGGLDRGGFYTVRLALPLDDATRARLVAAPRRNVVQFRFNGTDGESNGFRVLALALRDAQGNNLVTNPVTFADIGQEKAAGRIWSPDVAAGAALWNAQDTIAKSSIVTRKIHAACASCHSPSGRDLQYFNYSNYAIVQRSRFHGLSEGEGRQIAAYLRYSQQQVPHVAQAAPWNPPYQPGAGLDARPVAEWAAGAGLGAVLETPAQAVNAIFGKPANDVAPALTQAEIDAVMDPNATLNTREVAMPLQYPDWNAWLPAIHPLDVWPDGADASGSFAAGARFSASSFQDPNGAAARIEAWLKANQNPNGTRGDWSHLTPARRKEIGDMFRAFGWVSYSFLGGGRGNHVAASGEFGAQVGARNLARLASSQTVAGDPQAATTNAFIERSMMSLLHWNLIRQWDWAQAYGLEENQPWFIGDYDAGTNTWKGRGEKRGWPFNTVSAFYLAPHMLYQADADSSGRVTREWYMAWEANNKVGSYYRTNIWYQLQLSLNPGAQSDWVNFPMDWPYLTGFDEVLANAIGTAGPAEKNASMLSTARLLQAHIKAAQYVNNAIPLYVSTDTGSLINNRGRYGRAQTLKHLTPTQMMDKATVNFGTAITRFSGLDELAPGLYLKVLNGEIRQFNTLYTDTDPAAWRRCDPANTDLGESEPTAGFAFCVDRSQQPLAVSPRGGYAMNTDMYARPPQEQLQQYGIWKATQLGADPARVQKWSDWTRRIWP